MPRTRARPRQGQRQERRCCWRSSWLLLRASLDDDCSARFAAAMLWPKDNSSRGSRGSRGSRVTTTIGTIAMLVFQGPWVFTPNLEGSCHDARIPRTKMHFRSGHALLVLLGVSFSVGFGTNSNNDNGGSRLGLGLGLGVVVEAFAPSHSVSRGNRFAKNSCRYPSSSPTLNAEADSSSSSFASEGADADADAGPTGGGISMEAGGQLTKSEQQEPPSASSSDSAGSSAGASEYRPLQRQWWEVRLC